MTQIHVFGTGSDFRHTAQRGSSQVEQLTHTHCSGCFTSPRTGDCCGLPSLLALGSKWPVIWQHDLADQITQYIVDLSSLDVLPACLPACMAKKESSLETLSPCSGSSATRATLENVPVVRLYCEH